MTARGGDWFAGVEAHEAVFFAVFFAQGQGAHVVVCHGGGAGFGAPGVGLHVERQAAFGRDAQGHQKGFAQRLRALAGRGGLEAQGCGQGRVVGDVLLRPVVLRGKQLGDGLGLGGQKGFQRFGGHGRGLGHFGHGFKSAVSGQGVVAPGPGRGGGGQGQCGGE